VSGVTLSPQEEEELYVILKPREGFLSEPLEELLRRVETSLFDRFTIEEMEKLLERFAEER
jgi:hypothetical protein